MRVEYHPAIESELAEIRDFYNERSHNLGDDFINEFERQVLRIVATPTRWMCVRGDTRRALMSIRPSKWPALKPSSPHGICCGGMAPERFRFLRLLDNNQTPW